MNCTCQLCGYNWYNQRYGKTPSRCPACHSRRWNINPFDGIPDKHLIQELESRGYNVTAKIGFSNFPLVLPNGKTPAGELPNGNIPEESKPLTLLEQALICQTKLMQEFSEWLQSKFTYLMQHPDKSYPVDSKFKDLFWIIDTDCHINYVLSDMERVSKRGSKLWPVKNFALIIWPAADAADLIYYKFSPEGYLEPSPKRCPDTSQEGKFLFSNAGYRAYLHAYKLDWNREGCYYSKKSSSYEARKGWISTESGYLEIRQPGDTKGYTVLEEIDKLPFGKIPETSELEQQAFKDKHEIFIKYPELEEHHLKYKCSNKPPAVIPEGIPTDEKCSLAGCENYREDPLIPGKYYCYYNCLDFGEFKKCPFKIKGV